MLSRQAVRQAHAAAARHAAPLTKAAEQSTKLPSGLTVATAEHYGPIAHLVLAFRAGSRYENDNEGGLVHHIRNMVGTSSTKYGGAQLIWSAASAGADIVAFSTADALGIRVSVPRDSSNLALSVLGHLAGDQAFKEWEVEDVLPSLKTDQIYLQPTDYLFGDILKAAYRNGALSHSTYASKHAVGKFTASQLRDYASKHLVAGKAVLYGVNIEHAELKQYGDVQAPLRSEAGVSAAPSPYKGGEWRREGPGKQAHVLIVGPGASASDASGLAAQSVLIASLGTGAPTKYGSAAGKGTLAGAVKGTAAVSAYEQTFEGEGIVGAYLLADQSRVESATKSVARALKSFSANDLEGAKARAKNHLLRRAAHSSDAATSRSIEILAGLGEGAVIKAIDNVTSSQVEAAAKKMGANLSIASYGAVGHVPYRDQL